MFVLVTSDAEVLPHSSSHTSHTHHRGLHKLPGEDIAALDQAGGCRKYLNVVIRLHHDTLAGEFIVDCE